MHLGLGFSDRVRAETRLLCMVKDGPVHEPVLPAHWCWSWQPASVNSGPYLSHDGLTPSQEAKLLVAKAYRHTEKVLLDNLDKLQAVRAHGAKHLGSP